MLFGVLVVWDVWGFGVDDLVGIFNVVIEVFVVEVGDVFVV